MADVDESGWPALARFVQARRLELGLSVRAAADGAGINRATWATIEEGSSRLQKHRWARIERALSWTPGSIQAVIDGGQPTPLKVERGSRTDLEEELDRIQALDVPASTKRKLISAIVALFEEEQAEQGERRRSRTA